MRVAEAWAGDAGRVPAPAWSSEPPAAATRIRLVASDGDVVAQTVAQRGPAAHRGAYFAVEAPGERPRPCLQAVDGVGRVLAEIDTGTLAPPCRATRRGT